MSVYSPFLPFYRLGLTLLLIVSLVFSTSLAWANNTPTELLAKAQEAATNNNSSLAQTYYTQLAEICAEGEVRGEACFSWYEPYASFLIGKGDMAGAVKSYKDGYEYAKQNDNVRWQASYLEAQAVMLELSTGSRGKIKEKFLELIRLPDNERTWAGCTRLGMIYILEGKRDSAKVLLDRGYGIADQKIDRVKRESALSEVLHVQSVWERTFGSRKKAISLCLAELDMLPDGKRGALKREGIYQNLALIFGSLKDTEKATYYTRERIRLVEEFDLPQHSKAWAQLNLGYHLYAQRDTNAIAVFQEAYEYFKDRDDTRALLIATVGFVMTHMKMDQYEAAGYWLQQAATYVDGDRFAQASCLFYEAHGKYEKHYGRLNSAILDFEKVVHLSQETELWEDSYFNAINYLQQLYQEVGRFEESLHYAQENTRVRDSLFHRDQIDLVYELEAEYQSELKDQQILNEQLKTERRLRERNSILIMAILLLLGGGAAFWGYRSRVNFSKELQRKEVEIATQRVIELEQKNKLISLGAVIEGQESERIRVAKELHDGLGGLLSSVKSHFSVISQNKPELFTQPVYQKTGELIDRACTEVRQVAHNLAPHSITILGLQGALEDLQGQVNIGQSINCKLEIWGELDQLEQSHAIMLYRMIQELVNNVLKHAKAANLLIQCMHTPDAWIITVEDDGLGFDVEDRRANSKSLGLESIHSRAAFLNAEVDFDSQVGAGTTVTINVPQE
ncbi:MAG: ATP-binding protein [Bacteroidota bacterium]